MKIGILGGGQLGRMLIQAGYDWGLHFAVLSDHDDFCSKGLCSSYDIGDLNDFESVYEFGKSCEAVTIEIENVNIEALKTLESEGVRVVPPPHVIETIKDRKLQKRFYKENGIPTSDYYECTNGEEVFDKNIVVKKCVGGYDGYGVKVYKAGEKVSLSKDCIIEEFVEIEKEIGFMIIKNGGEMQLLNPVEMVFKDTNVLDYLIHPASIADSTRENIEEIAIDIAERLGLVGILAIEMFITKDGNVFVNEMAPRPHNSQHHTIDLDMTSQFEYLLRCICDMRLPMRDFLPTTPCIMKNILGQPNHSGPPKYVGLESARKEIVHIYGKSETRPGRKMGHITFVGANNLWNRSKSINVRVEGSAERSPEVGIIMGSLSDYSVMKEAEEILKELKVAFETEIVSAHRTPERMMEYAKTAKRRGLKTIIAGAGGAAHLPGMVASSTVLPVIGVPIKSSNSIDGWDSVLSILQMPKGVPVATVALNGSTNAGILAAQICGRDLTQYKKDLKKKVSEMNSNL